MDSFWHHTYGNGTDGGRNGKIDHWLFRCELRRNILTEDEHKRRGHPRRMFEIDQAGTFPLGVEQGFKTSNQCYGGELGLTCEIITHNLTFGTKVHETGFMTSSDPTLAHQRAFSPAAADGRWVSQDPPGITPLTATFMMIT